MIIFTLSAIDPLISEYEKLKTNYDDEKKLKADLLQITNQVGYIVYVKWVWNLNATSRAHQMTKPLIWEAIKKLVLAYYHLVFLSLVNIPNISPSLT